MIVRNMTSAKGNKVANQFIITDNERDACGCCQVEVVYFQSYDTVIAKKILGAVGGTRIYLDKDSWDYSVTTGKYRNIFLGESKKETERKIKDGTYILTNLN